MNGWCWWQDILGWMLQVGGGDNVIRWLRPSDSLNTLKLVSFHLISRLSQYCVIGVLRNGGKMILQLLLKKVKIKQHMQHRKLDCVLLWNSLPFNVYLHSLMVDLRIRELHRAPSTKVPSINIVTVLISNDVMKMRKLSLQNFETLLTCSYKNLMQVR